MRKSIVIIIHISYWICYAILLSFFVYLLGLNQTSSLNHVERYFKLIYFAVLPAGTLFYLSYFILFERYLKKRKILLLCSSIIFGAYLVTSLGGLFLKITLGYNILFDEGLITSIPLTFIVSSVPIVHGVFGIGMRAFISWFDEVNIREELIKKNFETELALVKSQISPHFLFNTINNIDTLIEMDSTKASQYLNKLSDIMRFMLYESKTEKIPVEKELHYIERYIELQKLRTSNGKFVHFEISGNYDSIKIEPMLFIPFIENAFKYAENLEDEDAITIKFSFEEKKIVFRCENKYDSNSIASPYGGLGNQLIKKRLSLLFPENHSLITDNYNGIYSVILTVSQ